MWGEGSGSGSLGWDPGLVVFRGGGEGEGDGGEGGYIERNCGRITGEIEG